MENKEIEILIIRAKQGNKEDLFKLYEQFKGFIRKSALKYKIKNHDICDLEQIAYLALHKAVDKYIIGSSTFSSYLYISIENIMKYTLRQAAKENNEFSLNTSLNGELDSGKEFIDTLEGVENIEEKVLKSEQYRELHSALSKLGKTEQQLIEKLYIEKNTLKSYADIQKIHYSKAQRDRDRILKGLRTYLQ